MSVLRFTISLILSFIGPSILLAQDEFIHPRGIITQDEASIIQQRIKKEPYKTWYGRIERSAQQAEKNLDTGSAYETSYLAIKQAQLYILTLDEKWAEKCSTTVEYIINDPVYFNDPISRGLTRAAQLMAVAMSYDLCYNAWDESQRKRVNEKLFRTMLNTNSNMGFSANYSLVSNWNGVRWGAALMAALVYDDFDKKYRKNPALPFIWDIQKRLQDHISQNVFPGGWSAESFGYHQYNWSFIGPAIIASQNDNDHPHFKLENFAPNALNSMWGLSTATLSLPRPGGKGIKPDFSDDNANAGNALTAMSLRLYPEKQIPALKWMHDYMIGRGEFDDPRAYLFYSICWYPDNIKAQNPEHSGWQSFVDESYGMMVWRNRFRDEKDIVVAFNAPLKRVAGHKGPDNLSFRILGLGNLWVTGGGRTGQIAGQTNLFPNTPEIDQRTPGKLPASTDFEHGRNGKVGFASARGSCMGVEDHRRIVFTEFFQSGEAIVKISDHSVNGKIWRINTPEFNEVEILENGYILTAPNGSKMKVTAPADQIKAAIKVSKVRYGGNTQQHNFGIGFGDRNWLYTKAIDIPCEGNIDVNIELIKKK